MSRVDEHKLRNLPGWPKAPVPICMQGDPRALTFCCKPGYILENATHCNRDRVLREIGMTVYEFVAIKEQFSEELHWADPSPCFKSLSYCCMRVGGCPHRDLALLRRYSDLSDPGDNSRKPNSRIMREYFVAKRELAQRILVCARNQEKVKFWLIFDE